MSSIGQRIRAAREDAGMSISQLAVACGMTERAVRLWEADQRQPMFRNVEAVAKATGKPLKWFAREEDEGDAAADKAVHR